MSEALLADRLADFNAYTLPFLPGLVAGEYPGRQDLNLVPARLRALLDAGITYFVDLTEEGELSPYTEQLPDGIVYRRHPITDVSIPRDPEEMVAILDTLDEARAQDHTVYLHCWGGVGRTGTVAGCYLVRHGLPGKLALRTVGQQFQATAKGGAGRKAPETRSQERFILDWTRHDSRERADRWEDRLIGALIGLAVGDALGTTLEFTQPGTFTPIDTIVGGGPFNLKPGQWTDDTSMALCLADSLAERDDFDVRDQMDRYVHWYRDGYRSSTGRCFDIGITVRNALERYVETGNPIAGSTEPFTAGNGSLMRLAPVAIHSAADPVLAIKHAAESSRTTHGAPDAVDACRYFAAMLLGAFRGLSKDELLDPVFGERHGFWRDHPLAPNIAAVAAGHWRHENPPDIRSGKGYVVDTLKAALWAFDRSSNFRDGALAAVNLGGDADTTGAVYGQLAGAYYGLSGIPEEWRAILRDGDQISDLAQRLLP